MKVIGYLSLSKTFDMSEVLVGGGLGAETPVTANLKWQKRSAELCASYDVRIHRKYQHSQPETKGHSSRTPQIKASYRSQ